MNTIMYFYMNKLLCEILIKPHHQIIRVISK